MEMSRTSQGKKKKKGLRMIFGKSFIQMELSKMSQKEEENLKIGVIFDNKDFI